MTWAVTQVPASPSRRTVWHQTPQQHWQSGDIQIRLLDTYYVGDVGAYPCRRYGLFIKHRGRWRRCHVLSRSCSYDKGEYGSAGQAKIGVGQASRLVLQDGTVIKRKGKR